MWFSLYYFFGISRSAPLVNLELPLSFSVFRENLSREKIALKHTNDEAAHDDDSLARVTGFAEFDPRKTSQQSLPPQTGQGDGRRISARSRRPADPADSRQGLLGVQPASPSPRRRSDHPVLSPRHTHIWLTSFCRKAALRQSVSCPETSMPVARAPRPHRHRRRCL